MSFSFHYYKGYDIHAAPYQLADTGEWTVKIHIFHDRRNETRGRSYFRSNFFKTKNEAVDHCRYFGRQIIDGKIENYTVVDL